MTLGEESQRICNSIAQRLVVLGNMVVSSPTLTKYRNLSLVYHFYKIDFNAIHFCTISSNCLLER